MLAGNGIRKSIQSLILCMFVCLELVLSAPWMAAAGQQSASSTAGITLVAIDVRVVDRGNGWQDLTVALGIRNDSATPQVIHFPTSGAGTFEIAEGYTYDAVLGGIPFNQQSEGFYGLPLPPGFTLCGTGGSGTREDLTPVPIQAHGQIPIETVPLALSIEGFPDIELTDPSSVDVCTPPMSGLPLFDEEVIIGNEGSSAYLRIEFQLAGSTLEATFENLNRFGDLTVSDARIFFIYPNGVWRVPRANPLDASCSVGNPIWIAAGPGQSKGLAICLPSSNQEPVGMMLTSESLGFSTAFNLKQEVSSTTGPSQTEDRSGSASSTNGNSDFDMPLYRGSHARTGVQPGPAPSESPEIMWQFATEGRILSAPVLMDGLAYVGSTDGSLYALDAMTGEERWRFETGSELSTPPTISGDLVYIGGEALFAIDASSGSQVWARQFRTCASSPLVSGDVLFIGADKLYALQASTGEELWSTPIEGCPSAPAMDGDAVYLRTSDRLQVGAYDAASGMQLWRVEDSDSSDAVPAIDEGTIYVGTDRGGVAGLRAADGEELWSVRPSVETDQGLVYRGREMTAPTVAGDTVYVGSDAGLLHALDVATGEERWHFATSGRQAGGASVRSDPSIVGGLIVFGDDDGSLHALNGTDGTEAWRLDVGSAILASPTVVNGVIYIGTYGGTVLAIKGAVRDGATDTEQVVPSPQGPENDSLDADEVVTSQTQISELIPSIIEVRCGEPSQETAALLTALSSPAVEAELRIGFSFTSVPLQVSELIQGNYSFSIAGEGDAALPVACGQISGSLNEVDQLYVPIRQMGGSGVSGIGGLILAEDGTANVVLFVAPGAVDTDSGAEPKLQPGIRFVGLVQEGACQDDGTVLDVLADLESSAPSVELPVDPVLLSTTELQRDLNNLGGNSIAVFRETEGSFSKVACGVVEGRPDSFGELQYVLREQNGSGLFGIAWLTDNGNGTTTVTIWIA